MFNDNSMFPKDFFSSILEMSDTFNPRRGFGIGPKLDMYEEKGVLVVKLMAPGFKEDEISISIIDNTLRITAQKKHEKQSKNRRYFVQEIINQSFTKAINLPYPVDESKAEAYFEDGYLIVKLPKLVKTKKGFSIIPIKKK